MFFPNKKILENYICPSLSLSLPSLKQFAFLQLRRIRNSSLLYVAEVLVYYHITHVHAPTHNRVVLAKVMHSNMEQEKGDLTSASESVFALLCDLKKILSKYLTISHCGSSFWQKTLLDCPA